MSSPMAGVAVVNAIVFGVYGQSKRFLTPDEPAQQGRSELFALFAAGALSGLAQAPICSLAELTKTRAQLQQQQQQQHRQSPVGPLQIARQIYANKGISGLCRGLGTTVLREIPAFGTYFCAYELLTEGASSDGPLPLWRAMLAGGLAGSASWTISYPLDVIKSRLQADERGRYSGTLDCLRQSLGAEGYRCLFRGLGSALVRAFPVNAVTFAVVAWTLRLSGKAEGLGPAAGTASRRWKHQFDEVRYFECIGDVLHY